jgi:hypothetical protein
MYTIFMVQLQVCQNIITFQFLAAIEFLTVEFCTYILEIIPNHFLLPLIKFKFSWDFFL